MHESIHRDVCGQVVDAVDRAIQGESEALRRTHTHEQCTDESRPGRDRDGIDVTQRDASLGRRAVQGGIEGLEVRATGDLGHHSPEACLLLHTRGHGIREQRASPDERDAGLVAGGLDPKDQGPIGHARLLRMMRASRPGP